MTNPKMRKMPKYFGMLRGILKGAKMTAQEFKDEARKGWDNDNI